MEDTKQKPKSEEIFEDEKKPPVPEVSKPMKEPKEKMLPVIGGLYEKHIGKVDSLNEKIAERRDKIDTQRAKLAGLNEKIERLENTNAMLEAVAGKNPIAKAIIEANERSIDKIREQKIPARESKIAKHKAAVTRLTKKRDLAQHKADKMRGLSGIIKSFVIPDQAQRREAFAQNMELLKEGSKGVLAFKIDKCDSRLAELRARYEQTPSVVDKYDIQKKMQALEERKAELTAMHDYLSAQKTPFAEHDGKTIDNAMTQTGDTLDQAAESGIKPSQLADNIALNGAEYMRNAEMQLEDDYNSIDDIINNGRREEMAEQSEVDFGKWLGDMVDSGKAEFKQSGEFMINNEYYKTIPREDKHVEAFSQEQAESIMSGLISAGVEFSAVSRKNDTVAITVHQKDSDKLTDIAAAYISEKHREPKQAAHKKQEHDGGEQKKVNPDYYKSLPKEQRYVSVKPIAVGRRIAQDLQKKNIPYSAVVRDKDTVAITVSKANMGAFKAAEKAAVKEHTAQLINPDFYKALPKDQRHTERMSEDKARQVSAVLDKRGIEHSAVLNGDKSGVTVDKKDRAVFFSRSGLKKEAARTDKNRSGRQKVQSKKKNQGIE